MFCSNDLRTFNGEPAYESPAGVCPHGSAVYLLTIVNNSDVSFVSIGFIITLSLLNYISTVRVDSIGRPTEFRLFIADASERGSLWPTS